MFRCPVLVGTGSRFPAEKFGLLLISNHPGDKQGDHQVTSAKNRVIGNLYDPWENILAGNCGGEELLD
jgi:hypothetical protein